ncbi:hypothetical protein MNB_SV-4-796 [hydrothermal vent metagenome]|uniref:Uncharacterized protein n=1 Tax=hydrothermal vent metagenome TaxID=652676 RepID=A0A1W1E9X8_9ZZZZ
MILLYIRGHIKIVKLSTSIEITIYLMKVPIEFKIAHPTKR